MTPVTAHTNDSVNNLNFRTLCLADGILPVTAWLCCMLAENDRNI